MRQAVYGMQGLYLYRRCVQLTTQNSINEALKLKYYRQRMENNRNKEVNRLKLTRTIDNKRTISSEQGHYHQRKYTIEYDTKRNTRQPLIQRKNQSLPKHLANTSQQSLQSNIRSRKLICSHILNDHKSSTLTAPTHHQNSAMGFPNKSYDGLSPAVGSHNRQEINRNRSFVAGLEKFQEGKYGEALVLFQEVYQIFVARTGLQKLYYFMGLSYWHSGAVEKAAIYLSKALDEGYQFSTQVYDMLSSFYESTKNYNCALKTLDSWLKAEISWKAHLMRARIYFFFKEYEKAIREYTECYKVQPTKLQAYIEQADTVYRLEGLEAGLKKYNNLLLNYPKIWPESQHSDINYVKYKKSLLLLQEKSYQQALPLLKQVTNKELLSQVNYYIGIICSMLGQYQEALLAFRQAVEANTSAKFVAQSYYEKFVLMFKKNEYYAIQYEIDIIGDQFVENEPLKLMRTVIEGIIYILKMNFQDGIQTLSQLQSQSLYQKSSKLYSTVVSSFKIFAYYSLHRFSEAIEQFNNITNLKTKKMSQSNNYNYTLLKAIKAANEQNFNQSLLMFDEAQKIQPFNTHTFMVKAIVQIMFYNALQSDTSQKEEHNQEILLSAEELLNRCLLKEPENDQILYILAAINYELGQYESGLKLIRKAIETSDDHTIKHYYLKANLKIMLEMYQESLNDYTNAILVINEQEQLCGTVASDHPSSEQSQIESNRQGKRNYESETISEKQEIIYECFLERAKCYILEGNNEKAESDLRRFFSQLQNVKKWEQQLDLFMHVGCSDVILDIYKSILEEQYDCYNRMKCYYLAKELNNCLNMMNMMVDFSQDDESEDEKDQKYSLEKLIIDRDCLEALKKSSQGSNLLIQQALNVFQQKIEKNAEGEIFKKADCIFYAGVMAFHLQDFPKAKNYFIDSKSEKLEQGEIFKAEQEQGHSIDNKLFSLQQINYNIAICDFMQQKWNPYLDSYPQFKRYHQSVSQNLLYSSSKEQEITPFPTKNRLCSIYAVEKIGNLCFRLSFCLPKIKLREVKFSKNKSIITCIGFKDIDMRPSAPWILKSKKGIIFTTDGLKESVDLKSEKSKKPNSKKRGEERYKEAEN